MYAATDSCNPISKTGAEFEADYCRISGVRTSGALAAKVMGLETRFICGGGYAYISSTLRSSTISGILYSYRRAGSDFRAIPCFDQDDAAVKYLFFARLSCCRCWGVPGRRGDYGEALAKI